MLDFLTCPEIRYDSMRQIPAYQRFVEDRFDRCLDLYLCPRVIKKRIHVDQESLLPKLPDPKDLRPFPSRECIVFKGHEEKVKTISVDPNGRWLASGSVDGSIKIWEVATGRLLKTLNFENEICAVSWNPGKSISLLAVAWYALYFPFLIFDVPSGKRILLVNPRVEPVEQHGITDSLFSNNTFATGGNEALAQWIQPTHQESKSGICMILELRGELTHLCWHRKGDYFASLTSLGKSLL